MQSVGCMVQGAWCRVQGAGCKAQSVGCRVHGVELSLWTDDKLCADKSLVKLAGMEVGTRECIVSG